jgi:hypothetical protein
MAAAPMRALTETIIKTLKTDSIVRLYRPQSFERQ